jgi:hypothetical protein
MRSAQQLCDVILGQLEAVFSMQSVPECYKQEKSRVYLVVRHSSASKGVKTEYEEAVAG